MIANGSVAPEGSVQATGEKNDQGHPAGKSKHRLPAPGFFPLRCRNCLEAMLATRIPDLSRCSPRRIRDAAGHALSPARHLASPVANGGRDGEPAFAETRWFPVRILLTQAGSPRCDNSATVQENR